MSVSSSGNESKRRRRVRSEDEKRRIVSETFEPGASVSAVARRHGLNANLLFTWRREMGSAISALADDAMAFVPAVIGAAPVPASAPPSPSPSAGGQMEIVFAGGERVIVDRTVDAVALARVIKVLSRR
ncbi:IS66-like element accessory protein TnpA [Reyranella massiliensis]|uniref:IS66-like element accessory protein TnpA n=1 Tax=Reyranella massiliensis TaxID=445220 RepID=UPI0005C293DA